MTSSRPGSEVRGHVRSFEGQRVEIRCGFRVLFARQATRVYRFRWTLNGLEVSPSRRVNITFPRQADLHGFWNSTLTFDPVIPSFSGQFNSIVIVIIVSVIGSIGAGLYSLQYDTIGLMHDMRNMFKTDKVSK